MLLNKFRSFWRLFLLGFKDKIQSVNVFNDKIYDFSVEISGSTVSPKTLIEKNTNIKNSYVYGNVLLQEGVYLKDTTLNGTITIGAHSKLFKVHFSGNIAIGRYTSFWGPNTDIDAGRQKVTIGAFCSIARNVTFQTYNHNHRKMSTYFIGQNIFKENWTNEQLTKGNIHVENDVWIGTQSVILGGVTIHNGAIVAANSVVTKDVQPYSIVAGSPAKEIGKRFDNDTIEKLLNLNWWEWEIATILENKELFKNEINKDFKWQ